MMMMIIMMMIRRTRADVLAVDVSSKSVIVNSLLAYDISGFDQRHSTFQYEFCLYITT